MKTVKILMPLIAIAIGLMYYFLSPAGTVSRFPKLPPKEGVTDIDWDIFNKITLSPDGRIIGDHPPEIKSLINKRIRLLGTPYLLENGIVNDQIHCFILRPAETADLSQPATEPNLRQILTVYVDSRTKPLFLKDYLFRTGQSRPLFYVEGTFQISAEHNFGLFILSDSLITPFILR